jgi:hypothetical protein
LAGGDYLARHSDGNAGAEIQPVRKKGSDPFLEIQVDLLSL